MSWEAFRLTSKSPSEVYAVMGPAGVDGLVRQALQECWNSFPEDARNFTAWKDRATKTFVRNRRIWSAIKKPTPSAFFDHLAPYPSDGYLRQAMILCWMMMPRSGGRDFKTVVKTMDAILARNFAAWEQDNRAFTATVGKVKLIGKKPAKKLAKKPAKKMSKNKSSAPKRKR